MANPKSDNWDWPYILYIGRVWLLYTDEEVLNLTPRKFRSQLDVHMDVQERMNGGKSNKATTGFVDNIPGW